MSLRTNGSFYHALLYRHTVTRGKWFLYIIVSHTNNRNTVIGMAYNHIQKHFPLVAFSIGTNKCLEEFCIFFLNSANEVGRKYISDVDSFWRHQMETFSALLAICVGNSPVIGEFPARRPVTRIFDVFFDLGLINSWVNSGKAGDLRRHLAHYDVTVMWRQTTKHDKATNR